MRVPCRVCTVHLLGPDWPLQVVWLTNGYSLTTRTGGPITVGRAPSVSLAADARRGSSSDVNNVFNTDFIMGAERKPYLRQITTKPHLLFWLSVFRVFRLSFVRSVPPFSKATSFDGFAPAKIRHIILQAY